MTASFNQDFITFVGDDVFPIFTVLDSAGAPVDISTVLQIEWYCQTTADSGTAADLTKTAGDIVFVTDGTDGKFQVNILAAVTTTLNGFYQHVARITDASGYVTTVTVGRMQVAIKPTWTYDATKLNSVPLFQVRRILGDVIQDDQQLSDSEILYYVDQRANSYGAAADCARALAAQYSRKVNVTSPGGMRTEFATQRDHYMDLAEDLEKKSRSRGAGVLPYIGGISVQDKIQVQSNPDRVTPSFNIGMDDNTIPVGQVGQETPTMPSGNPGP